MIVLVWKKQAGQKRKLILRDCNQIRFWIIGERWCFSRLQLVCCTEDHAIPLVCHYRLNLCKDPPDACVLQMALDSTNLLSLFHVLPDTVELLPKRVWNCERNWCNVGLLLSGFGSLGRSWCKNYISINSDHLSVLSFLHMAIDVRGDIEHRPRLGWLADDDPVTDVLHLCVSWNHCIHQ